MGGNPIPPSDDQILELLESVNAHGGIVAKAARALKMSERTARNWMGYAARRGLTDTKPVMEGFEIAKVSTQQNELGEITKTYITQKPERGPIYNLPDGFRIKGTSTLIDAEGRISQQWVKTREDDQTANAVDAIKNVFEEYKGRALLSTPPEFCSDELMTVYILADHHLGMFSWARETGNDYDLKIAESLLLGTMTQLVSQAPMSKTAIVLNLGDFYHADNSLNRTEKSGHSLDVDTRYAKVLQTGVKLMITCVELALAKHDKVIVRNLPGNHDGQSALALSVALAAFFD